MIRLPIIANTDIQTLFDKYCESELIEELHCSHCHGEMRRYLSMELPEVVFIQLLRFNILGKSDVTVRPSESLKFKDVSYTLKAVVEHTGSVDQGHYVTLLKSENVYVKCDDDRIFHDQQPDFQQGYMYVYQRTEEKEQQYCVCNQEYLDYLKMDEDEKQFMVMCCNDEKCRSKIDRLALLNKDGGHWFHYRCVGFVAEDTKEKRDKQIFYCKKCCNKKNAPKPRLYKWLKADGLSRTTVSTKRSGEPNENIYNVLCAYQTKTTTLVLIEGVKSKIKKQFELMCNSEYTPSTQIESLASQEIKLLLKKYDTDSVLRQHECILEYVKEQNNHDIDMLTLYI